MYYHTASSSEHRYGSVFSALISKSRFRLCHLIAIFLPHLALIMYTILYKKCITLNFEVFKLIFWQLELLNKGRYMFKYCLWNRRFGNSIRPKAGAWLVDRCYSRYGTTTIVIFNIYWLHPTTRNVFFAFFFNYYIKE